MKLATFQDGHHTIEVHNNFLTGIETVYFDGHQVARAFNWFHGTHQFNVKNTATGRLDHYCVEFVTSFQKWCGVAVDIYKNGEAILHQSGNTKGSVYTLEVGGGVTDSDGYDRRAWTAEGEPLAQPAYQEEDLV